MCSRTGDYTSVYIRIVKFRVKNALQLRTIVSPTTPMAPHLRGLWTEGLSGWPHPHAPCSSGSLLLETGRSVRLESPLRPGISLSIYPRGAVCCACFPISAVSCQVCSRAPGLAGYRVTGVFVWGCFDDAISTKGGRTNSEKRNAKLKKTHFFLVAFSNVPSRQ